jgi:myo-inositol-1(or 4)-monophosphatase
MNIKDSPHISLPGSSPELEFSLDSPASSPYEFSDVTPNDSDGSGFSSPLALELHGDDSDSNSSISSSKLTSIRHDLVSVAYQAGLMMQQADPLGFDEKRNTSDLVTETDKAIEDMISARLSTQWPGIRFLGEETFKEGQNLTDEPTFICDPIDGTLNFIHGFPNSAISLALAIDKKSVIGVVYNPFRGDLFTAVKGQGAYFEKYEPHKNSFGQRRKIPFRPVLPPLKLSKSLVAIEWGSQREGPNWELRLSVTKKLLSSKASGGEMVHSARSSGSAALDFCYVAAGIVDAFWEGGVWVWDIAAGWIILEESGGMVASANPENWNPTLEGRVYFAVRAAKREEQRELVEGVWRLMDGNKFVF